MKTQARILLALFIFIGKLSHSQSDVSGAGTGHVRAAGYYSGWDNTGVAGSFNLRNDFAGQPINFFTGGAGPLFQRMTILGSGGPTAGFVGIGLPAPAFQLDVKNRIDVDVPFPNAPPLGLGYFIGGFDVLQVPGVENTFVGKGTGAFSTVGAIQNTFVGFQAGTSNTTGTRNTYVGRAAGYSMVAGEFNTFLGADAGTSLSTGNANTMVGEHCGYLHVAGSNNTFMGSHAGQGAVGSFSDDNTCLGMDCGKAINGGDENTFTGMRAGFTNIDGNQNCFYGKFSGLLTNHGSGNVFLGYLCDNLNKGGNNSSFVGTMAGVPNGIPFQNLNNANGFGYQAIARANNTMILGNNSVNVGIGLSNDITASNGPTNKLEIDAGLNLTAPQPSGLAGASGLRFRDLHLGNTTSPVNGVGLSVDANGDVILVPAGGTVTGAENGTSISTITSNFVAFGQDIAQAGNPGRLLSNREVPQNGFNVQFIDGAVPTVGQNRISLGQPIPAILSTKFYVFNNIERIGGSFEMNAALVPFPATTLIENSLAARIFGLADPAVSGIGITGNSNNLISKSNIGVSGNAFNGDNENIGVMGAVPLGSTSSTGAFNYGGYFFATGAGTQNVGIYAEAANASAQNYAAIFTGNILFNGTLSGANNVTTSDQMFKTNIDSITNALSLIDQLIPRTYFMDTNNVYGMRFNSVRQYGLIAQEVLPVLPELISETTKPAMYDSTNAVLYPEVTYKTLNYNAFIALLIKGMQEQQQQIDSLTNQMNSCCSSNARMQNSNTNNITDVTLTNSESIVLNQNVPNPFAEQTTITYNLPESTQKAQLLFYDATGKLIKSVDLTGRGQGQINIFANDLSNGIYSYALVVDGQIADTKRMVKTQ